MKHLKRIYKFIAMVMILSIVSPFVLSNTKDTVAYAATIKLTKTSLTLDVGKTYTLKVSGTKSKVTWSSSNKAVATVSTTGKVTAKKEGTATVTALVSKKKYTCKVTVKKPVNPLVTNAPFAAQEGSIGKINVVFPKDWNSSVLVQQGNNIMVMLYPSTADMTVGTSNITISVQETATAPTYDVAKEYLASVITSDFITSQLSASGLGDVVVSGFTTSDYETKNGTAFKTEYKADYKTADQEGALKQVIYDLFINNYLVEVTITDIADNVTPDIYQATQYLLDSIQLKK
ncbi:MAG TPA: Ig-like domain-containing protein [Mobilitalea sp.]|nr:Ig-like domain-containing protein [Mobilitalea sp.]